MAGSRRASTGRPSSTRSTKRPRRRWPSRPWTSRRLAETGSSAPEGARALGASGGPISRNAGRCVQCSSCPLGCRIDAKRAAHVSYLPRAVAAGARVRAGVQVQRVLTENGRAVGLACRAGMPTTGAQEMRRNGRASAGRDWQVRAKAVISAGGAFGTPELLLRSGIRHPALGRTSPRPSRRLDRRTLRGGGARLGGRHAELLRGRVAAARASCSRRPSPRSPSAPSGSPARARRSPSGSRTSTTSPRSASTSTTNPRAGSA